MLRWLLTFVAISASMPCMQYLEPAKTVVQKLAGTDSVTSEAINIVAKAANVDRTRVFRWMKPKDVGGTGGLVPGKHHQTLLDWARKNNKPLQPVDFFVRLEKARASPKPTGKERARAAA